MTEREYEDWFAKYLGDVESTDDTKNSPLLNAPKPFKATKWTKINIVALTASFIISLLFAYLNSIYNQWLMNWISNALLNLSLGLLVSLFIFIFTNIRERNIAYYSDIIPILKKRSEDLHKAYFEYTFKFDRFYEKDFEKCYEAWHVQSNTSFVIIQYIEFLIEVLHERPKCFTFDDSELEQAKDRILDANKKIQEEFIHHGVITPETHQICREALQFPFYLVGLAQDIVIELQQNLYHNKYSKRTVTKGEEELRRWENE